MASMKCMQPQTASMVTVLQDVNGNAREETSIGVVSRRSFISKVKMHRYSKLEIFLAVVSLLLLVALVVVVVLMEAEKSEGTKTDDERLTMKKPDGAIKNLARVLNKMDRKANPCTDFYQYACGGWEKRNYIDDSEVFVLSYMEIGNENKRQLKEILENKEIKLNYSA
ncbi:neprilysin, partial [Paramuricea clavata]